MVAVMLMSVLAVAGVCVLAYTLTVYALPFMLGVAAHFAFRTGAGFIGAAIDHRQPEADSPANRGNRA